MKYDFLFIESIKQIFHCCPVKIVTYHQGANSRNSVLDIQALI